MATQTVTRYDSIPLNDTFYTDEGYFRDEPILTRVGVFEYKKPDGTVRRELRLPEDVFDPDSLKSYEGKPVVITHNAGEIDADNVRNEIIGTILTPGYKDGNDVRAKIIIHDTQDVENQPGRELSLGYKLDTEEKPGVWHGIPYDAIQHNIRVNHLAVVNKARAGEQAHLNMDGESVSVDADNTILTGGNKMSETQNFMTPDDLVAAITSYRADSEDHADGFPVQQAASAAPQAPAAQAAPAPTAPVAAPVAKEDGAGDLTGLIKATEAFLAALKAQTAPAAQAPAPAPAPAQADGISADGCQNNDADEPKENPFAAEPEEDENTEEEGEDSAEDLSGAMNNDSIDEYVSARLDLCRTGDKLNMDGLETIDITEGRKKIINRLTPQINLDGMDETHIAAYYDVAKTYLSNASSTDLQRAEMMGGQRQDSADSYASEAQAARARMIERQNAGSEGGTN